MFPVGVWRLGTLGTAGRLASRKDQAPDEPLLGGVLLAYFLALSAVELADGLGANFEHAVLHPVLVVFAGADGALHQHERALGQRARVLSERPEQISYVE